MTEPKVRCQATTRRGHPCQNPVRERGVLCHRHHKRAVFRALGWVAPWLAVVADFDGVISFFKRLWESLTTFGASAPSPSASASRRPVTLRERLEELPDDKLLALHRHRRLLRRVRYRVRRRLRGVPIDITTWLRD